MKTTKQLTEDVGKAAMLQFLDMWFPVTIQDFRAVFGRIDYQVTPVAGKGQKWVSSDRLAIGGE